MEVLLRKLYQISDPKRPLLHAFAVYSAGAPVTFTRARKDQLQNILQVCIWDKGVCDAEGVCQAFPFKCMTEVKQTLK